MKSIQTILDRTCDALRIPENRRHKLRLISHAIKLNEDEPTHVYLAVGEVITMGLAAHQDFMTTVPDQLRTAANSAAESVERRLKATIDEAVSETGALVQAKVVTAVEEFGRREQQRRWPELALGLALGMLVCVGLGWCLADRNHLSSSAFWSEVIASGHADDWQRIIELNPALPVFAATCGSDTARVLHQNHRVACRAGLWLTPASTSEISFIERLVYGPALLFERYLLAIIGALGCLVGAGVTALLCWRWAK